MGKGLLDLLAKYLNGHLSVLFNLVVETDDEPSSQAFAEEELHDSIVALFFHGFAELSKGLATEVSVLIKV